MKALFRFIGMLALPAVILVAVAALVIYTGRYDVSAKSGHTKLVEKMLGTVMMRSVHAHARDIVSPASMNLRDPAVLEKAAGHYEQMCRTCHGAPGKKPDPWLLYPPTPDLVDALRDRQWTDAEVFWIIKNGIKDTAMGAFGGSHPGAHSDEDIWGLTAFIRQMSVMTPEQYRTMSERAIANRNAQGSHQPTGRERQPTSPKSEASPSTTSHKH
jgi:hypothetical protein